MNVDTLQEAMEMLDKARSVIYRQGLHDITAVIDSAYDMLDDVVLDHTSGYEDDAYYERMMDPGYIYDLRHESDWEPYDDFDEGYADFIAEMKMEEEYALDEYIAEQQMQDTSLFGD